MKPPFSDTWKLALKSELEADYFHELERFVDDERRSGLVFPPENDVFSAFDLTPLDEVRVLILGQDPYHDVGQAHGLCFSVRDGIKIPPSLRNIFKEMADDLDCGIPESGYLERWARQGVLMINAVLTVRAHEAGSHAKHGWETFTDAVIRIVNDQPQPMIFVLWGNYARNKESLIDASRHVVLSSAHPSPLSARRGFFGSRPFSKINAILTKNGERPIEWLNPDSTKPQQMDLF